MVLENVNVPEDCKPGKSDENPDDLDLKKITDAAFEYAPNLMLVIGDNYRIEKINKAGAALIGRDPSSVLGMQGGDIFSCVNSVRGNGCGNTPECSRCSIRNIVIDTLETGKDHRHVEGNMDILLPDETITRRDFFVSTVYVPLETGSKVILYLDDISESKNTEKTLKEIEERFKVLYENMPGGTLIIGKDYIIEDVNQRTCEITGYKREELIGQLCDIVCPKGSLSKKCPIWVDGLEGFQGMDTAIKCKNGTKTPILKNSKRIFIEGNQFILENFQDISERKSAEEAIINSKIMAEEANRTKSEFLATMSHELRTPLNAVIGYSDLLLDESYGDLNDQQKRSLGHISHSGKHLLKLINDILDISKVESGKMEIHYETFSVEEKFGNVFNIVSPFARKKNIEISISIEPKTLSLTADRVRFKQILFNLASNAIKFTPDGGHVMLKACLKGDMAEFSVIDDGIGIAPDDLKKLFMPFQQIDSTISRKYDGTGLGLSLVKRFVDMHGGDVSVESEPGKGSVFSFRLPLDVVTH
ncbi:PAS domain S-box [Methanolobus tindarius DSM 2278]|jgi:PAS domain S-box-containing protein|uniref:histidine kinase n=1 Tax=Methanolobus tindarius DSM 2278 TaxID=1090322 RepID=W9DPJ2_METTI|nr:ATP-binding protein [Methanolobus tindarius]ETA67030.1 PAS domain S-box [Methanolobus tindarius DSM 2278]